MAKVKHNTSFFILLSMLWMSMIPVWSPAQELNCNVIIDASQVPDIQPFFIEDMKTTITSFLNARNWTEDEFKPEERIKCNLSISILSLPAQGVYQATAQLQSTRPVYGTTYETVMFNYFDKQFSFELNPGQPLNYNENVFNGRLTSLLSFYANVILSIDYDSFGKLGGSKYIEKAFNIANVAREAGDGWTPNDPNNRAALIENLNSQQMIPYREGWYGYHRLALDKYIKDPEEARKIMLEHIFTIKEVSKVKPYAILLRTFFMSKRDELINVFKDADEETKNKLLPILREQDSANSEKYQLIMKK